MGFISHRSFRRNARTSSSPDDSASDDQSSISGSGSMTPNMCQRKIIDEAAKFEEVIDEQDGPRSPLSSRLRSDTLQPISGTKEYQAIDGQEGQEDTVPAAAAVESAPPYRPRGLGLRNYNPKASFSVTSLVQRDMDTDTASIPPAVSLPHIPTTSLHSHAGSAHSDLISDAQESARSGYASSTEDEEGMKINDEEAGVELFESYLGDGLRTHSPAVLDLEEEKRRQSKIDEELEPPPISNEEKIRIIEEDFGVLASEGECEEIVWESDGAIRRGIALLGVIHLTTHRLTLHASLTGLQRRDDLSVDGIIHSSPATIHRPNPLRKRRIWLELTADMISTFSSSSSMDRIKPIRSVLVSDIIEVKRLEKDYKSLHIEAKIAGLPTSYSETFSFDTEEATLGWYNDIQYAIFLGTRPKSQGLSQGTFSPALPERSLDGEREGVEFSTHSSSPSPPPPPPLMASTNPTDTGVTTEPDMLEEEGIKIAIPLESIESYTAHALSETPMCKVSIHTYGGELDEVGFAFPWEANSVEGRRRMEDVDKWRGVRRRAREARGVGEKGQDLPPIVLQLGASSNWILPPAMSLEGRENGERVSGKPSIEVIMRGVFAIPASETLWMSRARLLEWTYSLCSLSWGTLAISSRFICFLARVRSLEHAKYRFPIAQFKGAHPTYALRGYGLSLDFEGHESLTFTFSASQGREDAMAKFNEAAAAAVAAASSASALGRIATPPITTSPLPISEHTSPSLRTKSLDTTPSLTRTASNTSFGTLSTLPQLPPRPQPNQRATSTEIAPLSRALSFFRAHSVPVPLDMVSFMPHVINLPEGVRFHSEPKHFVCLTIGSRGDVQPYIALGKGLLAEGHRVTIVTHAEYKEWIESWGIGHRTAGGDPGALMKLSVENKMFSPAFFRASLGNFREWLDELLNSAWEHCQDADVLIESPSAMAGVHIAEALDIPYFRAFTMPWTKTTEFPHAFIAPPAESPAFNSGTYVLFDNVFWVATRGQVNRWRRQTLHLENTDMSHLAQSRIPFIYNFSTAVVPKPLDWRDEITVSGYWFLDNPDKTWKPVPELLAFMQKAREDDRALVYIGFGSITVPNPQKMTASLVKAVQKSGVRAIISKGWSSRMKDDTGDLTRYPPECYVVDSIPHDWLFPLVDAALHHGGAGTTGASLRAGIPTLIKPWFGDQFFWASRVQKLGAGLKISSLKSSSLADSLRYATTDRIMKEKAAAVGQRIRSEDGVQVAIQAIYTYINKARRPTHTKSNTA